MLLVLPFLILLLIHHFFLARLIRKKFPLYLCLTALLIILFGVWCFLPSGRPQGPPPPPWAEGMAPPPGIAPPPPPDPDGIGNEPQGHHRPMRPEFSKLIIGILLIGVDLGALLCRKPAQGKKGEVIAGGKYQTTARIPADAGGSLLQGRRVFPPLQGGTPHRQRGRTQDRICREHERICQDTSDGCR